MEKTEITQGLKTGRSYVCATKIRHKKIWYLFLTYKNEVKEVQKFLINEYELILWLFKWHLDSKILVSMP